MKQIILLLSFFAFGFTLISLFTAASISTPVDNAVVIPDSIQQIFEKSCIECHNSNSKNKRSRKKLEFDRLMNFKTYQIVGKMVDVAEVIVRNDMPPRRFVKKHPEKALTYKDRQLLVKWVNELTEQPKRAQVTFDSQLDELNSQIAKSLTLHNKSTIAVLDFSDTLGNITNLGRYISAELSTRLYFVGEKKVFNRQHINEIVKNSKLSFTGPIDDTIAMKIGKLLGVDAIAYGFLDNEGSVINVNTRLLSADSGKVLTVASVDIPKEEKVTALFSQTVTTISEVFAKSKRPKPVPAKSLEPPVVEKGGLVFELLNAHLEDSAVVCVLKITNPGENHKEFQMRAWFKEDGNTVVYDDLGNAYYISAAKFDNKMVTEMFNVHKTSKTIYAGTSLNLEIHFKDAEYSPKKAKKIKVLKIISEIEPWYTVEFLNVPLNKD